MLLERAVEGRFRFITDLRGHLREADAGILKMSRCELHASHILWASRQCTISVAGESTAIQMSSYLGTMIYRGACVAAVVWAVVILLWSAYLARPDWTICTPIAVGGAAVIWGFGRGCPLPPT
jgi:hypothetical protein